MKRIAWVGRAPTIVINCHACLRITAIQKTAYFLIALTLCSCTSEEVIDRINGLPSDDRINDQYSHVSKSAPESLKPFYDADLTRKLNE